MIAIAQAAHPELSLRRLCALLGINRAWYYARALAMLTDGPWEGKVAIADTRGNYWLAGRVVAMRGDKRGIHGDLLHSDYLGSTSSTSNGDGISGAKYYDDYGRVRGADRLRTTSGFTGQRQDDTGLYYYGAHYYVDDRGKSFFPRRSTPGPMAVRAANGSTTGNRRGRRVRPRRGKETSPGRTSRGCREAPHRGNDRRWICRQRHDGPISLATHDRPISLAGWRRSRH